MLETSTVHAYVNWHSIAGFFDSLFSEDFQTWIQNFRQQAKEHSTSLSTEGYIRLVVIVCGYCLLRPYLLKLGGRFQASDHERELDDASETVSPAAISPNALSGQIDIPDDSDSQEETQGTTSTSWGRGARRRQRKMIKEMVEADEKRKAQEEEVDSDQEIEEFLRKAIN